MMRSRESLKPPPGAQAVLRSALPRGSTRDAIFGDLHEELLRDATRFGIKQARARYRSRAAGIVAHALWDSLCWRVWTSPGPARSPSDADRAASPHGRSASAGRAARAGRAVRDIGFVTLPLAVLAASIIVNTTIFSAVTSSTDSPASTPTLLVLALGVASAVILLASAAVAAVVICTVPRWRHRRRRPG